MSEHETFFADTAFPALTGSFFGDPGTFSPVSGPAVEDIQVIIIHDAELSPEGQEFGVTVIGTTIEALISDVGAPKRGDIFTVGSVDYKVKSTAENNGTLVKVVVNES